jgi:hypothetical protein
MRQRLNHPVVLASVPFDPAAAPAAGSPNACRVCTYTIGLAAPLPPALQRERIIRWSRAGVFF